ncbi:MAG: hypothetical protein B7Z80_19540 [Rhodospirillales bacterium 20-64-7]|nr:MAG: hypothetical protein B7Z80_19540 [Rhodospirillales bacterium 20-64-7]
MEQLAADATNWDVSAPAASKVAGMQLAGIRTGAGLYPSFQPSLSEHLGEQIALYEPSVYGGTGQEERVNIVMTVSDSAANQLREVEQIVKDKLREFSPNVDKTWNSCIGVNQKGLTTLKSKIRVRGEGRVKCYDRSRIEIQPPSQWRNISICPVVEVRGAYLQRTSCGLILEVVACILGDAPYSKATIVIR